MYTVFHRPTHLLLRKYYVPSIVRSTVVKCFLSLRYVRSSMYIVLLLWIDDRPGLKVGDGFVCLIVFDAPQRRRPRYPTCGLFSTEEEHSCRS